MKDNPHISPPFDLSNVRHCSVHDAHWIPGEGWSEGGSSCPWCQRDKFWDALDDIQDVMLTASRQGQPLILPEINIFLERLRAVLGYDRREG